MQPSFTYWLLSRMPTISSGSTSNLKLVTDEHQIYLSRMFIGDHLDLPNHLDEIRSSPDGLVFVEDLEGNPVDVFICTDLLGSSNRRKIWERERAAFLDR